MEVLAKLDSPEKVFVASVARDSQERSVVQVYCRVPCSTPGLTWCKTCRILCLKSLFHHNTFKSKRRADNYVIYGYSITFIPGIKLTLGFSLKDHHKSLLLAIIISSCKRCFRWSKLSCLPYQGFCEYKLKLLGSSNCSTDPFVVSL